MAVSIAAIIAVHTMLIMEILSSMIGFLLSIISVVLLAGQNALPANWFQLRGEALDRFSVRSPAHCWQECIRSMKRA
ncbi:protein of unknown function [Pseudorhizobium banfieldiae]|uniref:Uncharacterized protein n=1 Tax=Pseudorhizobium banfieldiae TaxID=1125847 RepID=L0NEI9_9HYPH|nr:protein of unknown function [Pseudorhizobium banfieldiae]